MPSHFLAKGAKYYLTMMLSIRLNIFSKKVFGFYVYFFRSGLFFDLLAGANVFHFAIVTISLDDAESVGDEIT